MSHHEFLPKKSGCVKSSVNTILVLSNNIVNKYKKISTKTVKINFELDFDACFSNFHAVVDFIIFLSLYLMMSTIHIIH